MAHEAHASRHWLQTVLRENWFPAVALAYLLIALAVGSVVDWGFAGVLFWIVLGVCPD